MYAKHPGTHTHQHQRQRCGIVAGKAGAAISAVQSSRARDRHRGRDGYRPGGNQATGRTDGRHHRRGKHRRGGQRILDRTDPGRYTATCRWTIQCPRNLRRKLRKIAALRTLLYVEDNPANLMLVEQIIEGHPHLRMLSAHDGNLGIALARAHLPDVILMDINLPGISGIQALKILREDPATTHIPVIALSANAMPRDIEKGLEAGFFRYLTKPIKINEFMKALDDALKFSEKRFDETNETGRIR